MFTTQCYASVVYAVIMCLCVRHTLVHWRRNLFNWPGQSRTTLWGGMAHNVKSRTTFKGRETINRRRRSRGNPVLTAISLVNGKPWETVNFDPPQNRHTLTDL